MEWDTVIGLEVHAQLKTKSKLFSGAATLYGSAANSQTSFIDAGLPGVLPVLNKAAVTMAIQFGLAVNADINEYSVFERKNYFYPDLPKGYQISQFQKPIVSKGQLAITLADGSVKHVLIERAHLEEDAGKSIHDIQEYWSAIDLNRAGIALLEIVTSPCLYSAEEAIRYLKTLHQLLRFLGICDGNMQEGSFRCDVNLSLKPRGSKVLGTRTELKNLNSFKYIEKALAYEIARHQDLLETGQTIFQETRLYNPDTNTTHAMREKEFDNDYRYFPDPDLLPVEVTRYQIAEIKKTLPDLPHDIYKELQTIPSLNEEDIHFILSSPEAYHFYQAIKKSSHASDKLIINWLKGSFIQALNESNSSFASLPLRTETMAKLLDRLEDKIITTHQAKILFTELWRHEADVDELILDKGFVAHQKDSELEALVQQLLTEFPAQVAEYKAGKEKLLGFFVGQIMKRTKGQANPEQVSALVKQYIETKIK